ncbi:uncharacterized protein LOC128552614 [Mercenaria mercenaria]|uniref:uncharacterized protein LOC128552614 n=1 Tax=Mercenaria mercenaria TaxID=6596 RepID=UPI00234EC7EE|nr:uncharacterized protein LOC128552614 [Mercenaria mercenaria]
MEKFYWSAAYKDKDTLSYCLVTFKAAVQYLMTTSFDDIDLKTHGAKNEMSVRELVENRGASFSKNVEYPDKNKGKEDSGNYVPSRSRYDRQMDNITKMLEESTKDMGSAKAKPVRQPIVASIFGGQGNSVSPQPEDMAQPVTQSKKEDMGDFLSSLQNDMFLSFGKQT